MNVAAVVVFAVIAISVSVDSKRIAHRLTDADYYYSHFFRSFFEADRLK